MPGPPPKPAAARRRRNKTSTAAVIVAPDSPVVPPLPPGFSDQAQAWWVDLWATPMAPEFDRSDVHGLVMLAELVDLFWTLPPEKVMSKVEVAKEIRLQRAEYGLTPLGRRRLQWEIGRAEEATAKTAAARKAAPVSKRADPRLKSP